MHVTYCGTAREAGEERWDRQTGEFCLYPQKNGQPLQDFKPDNDTVGFLLPKDCSQCGVVSRLEESRRGVGGPVGDHCQGPDEQAGQLRAGQLREDSGLQRCCGELAKELEHKRQRQEQMYITP